MNYFARYKMAGSWNNLEPKFLMKLKQNWPDEQRWRGGRTNHGPAILSSNTCTWLSSATSSGHASASCGFATPPCLGSSCGTSGTSPSSTQQADPAIKNISNVICGRCCETFHGHNLQIFLISQSVCSWQAFAALPYVWGQGQENT